jgi:hypothetical protein
MFRTKPFGATASSPHAPLLRVPPAAQFNDLEGACAGGAGWIATTDGCDRQAFCDLM